MKTPKKTSKQARLAPEPRFVYEEIGESEARALMAAGEKLFVHPFRPAPVERFIPNTSPVQVQMAESGARLQPEMYLRIVDRWKRNGRKV